ncbi:hypothetical protein LguiB_013608 [Lonicera macranthoides]
MASKSSVASFLIYCVCLVFFIILFVSPGIVGRGFPDKEISGSKLCLCPSDVCECKPPKEGIP